MLIFSLRKQPICLMMLTLAFITGCAGIHYKSSATRELEAKKPESLTTKVVEDSAALEKKQAALRESLENKTLKQGLITPVIPEYNPLDDHTVSFSIVDESLETMLYSLAKSVGMNLIIDPLIEAANKKISMNFEKVPASAVLAEVVNIFDLHFDIRGNIIRIQPFQEKHFRLNFLDSKISASFDIGGDVLGSSETGSVSGLTGNFKLSGEGSKDQNAYDILENSLKRVLSRNGRYSLNRLAGNLYVKDSPSRIKTISKLIADYKKALSKQILIDARIVEVTLSDVYKYGIDWKVVTDKATTHETSTSAAWNNTAGLILGFTEKYTAIDFTLDALKTFGESKVVSNPTIRSKHGKPAIISVGTSITYIKSEETESSSTSSTTSDTKTIETSSVFDGLILGVIPFIDENDKITLLINPIKSDVDRSSLELVGTISLPQVNIKEISTTISMNNNETVVLGGLIDKKKSEETSRVPYLSKIPILGNLFKHTFNNEETRELVIILSVTIL